MKNGWTGGQYSIVRAIFGIYLCIHFLQLAPWASELFSNQGLLADGKDSPLLFLFPNVFALVDGPLFVTGVVLLAAVLSVCLIIGWHDRIAAVLIWYIWACLHGRMPLINNPGLAFVGWMLLAHACLPAAPYGSLAARRRIDPGDDWRMPPGIFMAAWILLAVGYSYSGLTKLISPSWLNGTAMTHVLHNPLARLGLARDFLLALPSDLLRVATWGALLVELCFAPLALISRLRPFLWGLLLIMHMGLMLLIDFMDLSLGMAMFHLFTFDPAWVRSGGSGEPRRPGPARLAGPTTRTAADADVLFYDGNCGMCHHLVRFLLAEDCDGAAFRFAPLAGETFLSHVTFEDRARLPDSVVVLTAEKKILTRSRAVRYVLQRLGGIWRVFGVLLGVVPVRLLDIVYDGIARFRSRLFAKPEGTCPILPKHLRGRFME